MDSKEETIYTKYNKISLFSNADSKSLVIYNAVQNEAVNLWDVCRKIECPAFSLAVVNDVEWNKDMSPWRAASISEESMPFLGGADEYLSRLIDKMLPEINSQLPFEPAHYYIAGYSLAGVFALYSAYHTDIFERVASISGSLWYPDFVRYVREHSMSEKVDAVYLSLGDKERFTRNTNLSFVEKNTKQIEQYLKDKDINTTFVLNKGNHFQNAVLRTAQGIKWILEQ